MEVIGIIAEYNPFHNGHLYQIKKIKELYKDSLIIVVLSSCFMQRGEVSVLNKWDKARIALDCGVNLVIELPFSYASQSADTFSEGALKILSYLNVDRLVFGSESGDINELTILANTQIKNKEFERLVKENMKSMNYPTALSKALEHLTGLRVDTPNDLLAISYIKEIIKNNYNIKPVAIKRTNDYHDTSINGDIISASAIRKLINEDKDISKYVPKDVDKYIYKDIDIYPLLRYKIISESKILNVYQTVDEGLENRLRKYTKAPTLEEYRSLIKSKRYTFNRINRMFIHILTSFTKDEAKNKQISYIRALGFDNEGRSYLKRIKKNSSVKVISGFRNVSDKDLDIELRVSKIYSMIVKDESLIEKELKKPIMIER